MLEDGDQGHRVDVLAIASHPEMKAGRGAVTALQRADILPRAHRVARHEIR